MNSQIEMETAFNNPLTENNVRYCQMCDERWDEEEQRNAQLPWGGPRIPRWMITWWRDYCVAREGIERLFAEEFKHYDRLEDFYCFQSTLDNYAFGDLKEGSPKYGPYCRLYAFCDGSGRLYFADTIACGDVVDGWASIDCRYRFKDLIEQAGSLDS
jgi:hypothetical protein